MNTSRIFFLLLSAAGTLLAQSTATVTGQVTDQSGAVVPSAKVVVKCVETGVEIKTTSNSEGYFTVPSLLPLNYTVSAETPGFKKAVSAAQKLDSATTARFNLVLVPMDSIQVVEVSARPPALQTTTAMVATL